MSTASDDGPDQPSLVDVEGRVRLSFSRISTYRQCPLQFRYRYRDGLPSPPSPHLSFGRSVHAALEWLYDRKVADWPDEDELLQHFYEVWDSSGFVDVDRDEQLRYYRRGQDALRRFHRRERDRFRIPAGTEVYFELPLEDRALIVGSIDRVDVDDEHRLHLVDYKTGKLRDREQVAGSLQLALYAMACEHLYGRLPATVCLDFVVAGPRVRVPTEDLDLAGARRAALDAAAAIRAERFDPTPNRLCAWCDYRRLCPAWEDEGPDVLGPAVAELRSLRRSVDRDRERLRALEAGVERARADLEARGLDPVPPPGDEQAGTESRGAGGHRRLSRGAEHRK